MSVDITTVIATYRRPQTLAEALQSILAQSGVRLEIVVVDDCPDGSAASVVRAMADPRIRYLHNPRHSNGRPAVLRNMGAAAAAGELVHFADDDDLVPAGLYASVMQEFAHHPHVGAVFGKVEVFGDYEDRRLSEGALFQSAALRAASTQRWRSRYVFAARILFQPLMIIGGASVVRRRCIEAVGGLDASMELMEDVDFYLRVIRRFGVRFLDRVALRYRLGPSLMHRPDYLPIMIRSYVEMQRKYRATHGPLEFYALKIAARTVLR